MTDLFNLFPQLKPFHFWNLAAWSVYIDILDVPEIPTSICSTQIRFRMLDSYSTSCIILWRSSPCLWSDADPEPSVAMTHQWTTKTFWGFHRAVGHHHEDSQSSAHVLQTRSLKLSTVGCCFAFLKKLRFVLFRNWDREALVVSVFPVPAGPAGLSFFRWLLLSHAVFDTEFEVWSHQPHQSQPSWYLQKIVGHVMNSWASGRSTKEHTKGLRPGFCFWMSLMKGWNCDILSRRLGEIAPICQSCDDQPKIAGLTLPFHLVLLRTS